ncbi:PPE domain-containing protein [Saccharopolyspora gregorii]|uniref:PPE domain-containing protein n=1 Tax=Saccharopolyspora gregorii TaxID=33914 RepID=A0ABP6S2Q2_9PSEU
MGLISMIDNAGSRVFGYESSAEKERKEHGEEANRIAQQQQAQLAQQNAGMDVQGFDKPAITQCVNWGGFDHAQIYSTNQDSIDQGKVGEVAQVWIEFAKELRGRGENYATDVQRIVEGGWEGEAANTAKEVGKPASDWMRASADAFEVTGNNLNAAGEAAGQARNMVDQPDGYSVGRGVAASIPFGPAGAGLDALGQMEEREQAEKAAQETMGRVYSPTLTQVDSNMPQYTGPDGSTKEPPAATQPAGTDWGTGPGANGVGPGTGGGIGGGTGGGVGGGIGGGGLPGGGYGSGGTGGFGGGAGSYPGSPSGSGSQWSGPAYGPGTGGVPGGPGGLGSGGSGAGAGGGLAGGIGGLGAGGAGGAGRGAGGLGAGGGAGRGVGTSGVGAGGRAGVGGTGAGAGAGAAGGARGAGAGRGGMGGGMGGAGQRGQSGEDAEHERPSWLEEHDDIWMNDMPKTAPPVLGE